MRKALAAAAVLAGVVAIYLRTGSMPDVPSSWDVAGGPVATTCWTVDVNVPCDTGRLPPAVCPTTDDEIVRVVLRAPTDPAALPAALLELGGRAEGLVDSYRETPASCPTNGKVLQVVGPADDGATCVAGDVTGGGAARRFGRCCHDSTCACAGTFCVRVPRVEVAGHEGVGERRLCRAVRAGASPPAQLVTYCSSRGL